MAKSVAAPRVGSHGMGAPTEDIAGCKAAHARLVAVVAELADDAVGRPSLLPDWTVGHVLTHLARNADSVLRRLDGAARGEVVDQYPGGHAGRAAEIEAGAGRSAGVLVADVLRTAADVDAAFDALPSDRWGALARGVSGVESPVSALPAQRWREVEVHLVDLGLGYLPTDWPPKLVDGWLRELLAGLPDRTDPRALLAWALGRGPAPAPKPW